MPNPYRDSLQRFTTREGQLANIQAALDAKDSARYLAEREALRLGDKRAQHQHPSRINNAVPAALAYKQDDLEERERVLTEGTAEECEYYLQERSNRPEFHQLLAKRDEAKEIAKQLHSEYEFLNQAYTKKPGSFDYEVVRQKGFESLDAYENLQMYKAYLNEYKDLTAPVAARYSELLAEKQKEAGEFHEYTAEELEDLQATGSFPSGSREWLEQRQNGIGGSDVGKIIGVEPAFAFRDEQEVLKSKIEPITDEEVEEQAEGHSSYTGYAGRGNAWEEVIQQRFAQNNPDANIVHCKTSWQHKDRPYQLANFDGLMTDENGVPNGILEIKTASDPSKWGDPKDGLAAIPPQYRAQALWYCDAAGFQKGAVAVLIDDHEYREYHFTVTPEIQQEMEETRARVEEFNKKVAYYKANPGKETYQAAKGFSPTFLTRARRLNDSSFKTASAYRQETLAETKKRFAALMEAYDEEARKEPENVATAMRQLFAEVDPKKATKPFVGLDIETSGMHQTRGRIIEVGISTRNPEGGEAKAHSKLYGIPPKAMTGGATGAQDVHNISQGMISKKRQFSNPGAQRETLEMLKQGTLVAHNATYEIKWLRQHLDGFAEAYDKGDIQVLDTMHLSQYFVPETQNNKLETFVEHHGIPYAGAHRAYNDAAMMSDALDRFRENLHASWKSGE